MTMAQVLAHPWMKGPIPTTRVVQEDFAQRKALIDLEAMDRREAKRVLRSEIAQSGAH